MKSSKNVILIGMPGSGKSTVGVVLAKVLGYRFIDSDLEIQSQEGKRLPELIEEFGTEGFLDIEARVNASIEAERCVIATGGSVVYRDSAMQHLKEIGTVVYLKLTCEELEKYSSNFVSWEVSHFRKARPCRAFMKNAFHFMKNMLISPSMKRT